jgi:hypothetical protein
VSGTIILVTDALGDLQEQIDRAELAGELLLVGKRKARVRARSVEDLRDILNRERHLLFDGDGTRYVFGYSVEFDPTQEPGTLVFWTGVVPATVGTSVPMYSDLTVSPTAKALAELPGDPCPRCGAYWRPCECQDR